MPAPTILVFDSGLGGLTVFREAVKARPDASYVYLADDERFPYGHIPETELVAACLSVIGNAIAAHRPDIVIIACNTASTLALKELRGEFQVPFVGTVPAIKPACAQSKSRRVAVLGTQATVSREYTHALIREFAQGCDVTLVGSARLAAYAEAELHGAPVKDEQHRHRDRALLRRKRRRAHRHRGAGLHPLSAIARPPAGTGAMAGRLDRSGAGHRPPPH